MGPALHVALIAGLAALAYVLARVPRTLFTEAAGGVPPKARGEGLLALGLLAVGVAVFESGLGGAPLQSVCLAAAMMAFGGVVYSDIRFLVIPDLYTVVVAIAAFAGPLAPTYLEAFLGAVICGGLLLVVAWIWKRRTAVEGLGFGDVKLAAAIGAMLGPERGLWAITISAAGGAVLGLIVTLARRKDEPLKFPYGVPLALAGAGFLLWRLK
jgi:leader peptidase (prepilin peptidase) / N-methyltransferase